MPPKGGLIRDPAHWDLADGCPLRMRLPSAGPPIPILVALCYNHLLARGKGPQAPSAPFEILPFKSSKGDLPRMCLGSRLIRLPLLV